MRGSRFCKSEPPLLPHKPPKHCCVMYQALNLGSKVRFLAEVLEKEDRRMGLPTRG